MVLKLGERGFRVLPSLDKPPPNKKQLKKTQKLQLEYFLNIETKIF